MARFSHAIEKIRPHICRLRLALTILIAAGCFLSVLLVYIRAFLGTEITDEAYYVADALGVLNGNIPYAYNNSFLGIGFTFLEIPFLFFFKLFVPDGEGVFLFSRLCFLSFKLLALTAVFFYLRRRIRPLYLLIFLTCVFTYSGLIPNFNYNSIPPILMILAGTGAFASVEEAERPKKTSVFFSGFLCGMAVFSNPVYFVCVVLIFLLVIIRSQKEARLVNSLFFVAGGLTEIVLVFLPIIFQTGFRKFWIGFYTMLPGVIHVDPLSAVTPADKLGRILDILDEFIYILLASLAVWLISRITTKLVKKDYNREIPQQALMLTLAACICIGLITRLAERDGWDSVEMIGAMGIVALLPMLLLCHAKKDPLLLYLGLGPAFCVFITIFASSSDSVLLRFGTGLFSVHVMILILMKNGWRPIRYIAILCAAVCIYLQTNTLYMIPYRDAELRELNTRVETGVYKGMFTTPQRAKDLPELENFLNERITEDISYSFRDNVPCAYLMTHAGTVCENSSWDVMQYTYHRNAPVLLYKYYERRDKIPELIIYIDYGRDDVLSIETDWYRYNDWVNTYYEKTEDIALNETFSRVIVYRYNGSFDGNYQRWIGN